MKQLLSYFILMPLLLSCSKIEKPEVVAANFITAMQQEDFSKAKEYATSESASLIDGLATVRDKHLFPIQNADSFTIKKVIQKDASVIVYMVTQKNIPLNVVLKKQGNTWKVAYDMQTLMKTAFDEAP